LRCEAGRGHPAHRHGSNFAVCASRVTLAWRARERASGCANRGPSARRRPPLALPPGLPRAAGRGRARRAGALLGRAARTPEHDDHRWQSRAVTFALGDPGPKRESAFRLQLRQGDRATAVGPVSGSSGNKISAPPLVGSFGADGVECRPRVHCCLSFIGLCNEDPRARLNATRARGVPCVSRRAGAMPPRRGGKRCLHPRPASRAH
jgi:hypothetical protein